MLSFTPRKIDNARTSNLSTSNKYCLWFLSFYCCFLNPILSDINPYWMHLYNSLCGLRKLTSDADGSVEVDLLSIWPHEICIRKSSDDSDHLNRNKMRNKRDTTSMKWILRAERKKSKPGIEISAVGKRIFECCLGEEIFILLSIVYE